MEPQVILVTGASSGIGAAAAKALAAQGAIVYGAARRVERIPEGVLPLKMDLADEASVQAGVDRILQEQGRIDVLVNNAGYGYFGPIETVPMEEARRQLEVNVFGLAALTKRVIPAMRERGSGRLVNVASVAGHSVLYFGGWYNVSKFAVEAFSDALRMELKPFGVKVVIVEPGAIRTEWGAIAAAHLRESSQGTAYAQPGENFAANMEQTYSSEKLFSKPEVVSRAIVKAVNARRPRTRYRVGIGAGFMVHAHTLLPDRWWDALMRKMGRKQFRLPKFLMD